jgi:isopentenyldiphosphate isomerase
MVELIDVIDENNNVINTVEYGDIYKNKLNHRIVHILVINPETKQIYLQKRSNMKSYLPGFYCTSAGGHVQTGETHIQAAKRELFEEIGLNTNLDFFDDFTYEEKNHTRLIHLYLTYAKGGFNFNDGEVESGCFYSIEEITKLIQKNEKIHPQLEICFKKFISK